MKPSSFVHPRRTTQRSESALKTFWKTQIKKLLKLWSIIWINRPCSFAMNPRSKQSISAVLLRTMAAQLALLKSLLRLWALKIKIKLLFSKISQQLFLKLIWKKKRKALTRLKSLPYFSKMSQMLLLLKRTCVCLNSQVSSCILICFKRSCSMTKIYPARKVFGGSKLDSFNICQQWSICSTCLNSTKLFLPVFLTISRKETRKSERPQQNAWRECFFTNINHRRDRN